MTRLSIIAGIGLGVLFFATRGGAQPGPPPAAAWERQADQALGERLVRIFAGGFVLASLLLAWAVNDARLFDGPTWLWFRAFVGANLLQSGFSRWFLLVRLGVPSAASVPITRP